MMDTAGQTIVVIGAGPAAEAKLRGLIKSEARIVVMADEISAEIARMDVETESAPTRARVAELAPILLYAATEDDPTNSDWAAWATAHGIPVNAADQKDACSFITPAIVDRTPVVVAIGTEGTAPGLARAIKADLEGRLPDGLGETARETNTIRARVAAAMPDLGDRQKLWARVFGGRDLTAMTAIDSKTLRSRVDAALSGHDSDTRSVTLVGAGPGDPGLLTLAARRALHAADVIIYDKLVSQGVLDFARREATYIYVGKSPGQHHLKQFEINALLLEHARPGIRVVRLKGGDPSVFGRADEEITTLREAGVQVTVAPGITSASAAAAALGQSLTARGRNSALRFITGHDAHGPAEQDWKALAKPGARVAVYMGVGAAPFIQRRLLLAGAEPDTSVRIVEKASRRDERVVPAALSSLSRTVTSAQIQGPALLMIGYGDSHDA